MRQDSGACPHCLALFEALEPFLDLRHQRDAWGVISKGLGDLAPIVVTVTKGQMIAAVEAHNKAKGA